MPSSSAGRLENLLGALQTALSDSLTFEADSVVGHSGATASALTYLAQEPGLGIEQLKGPLGLSQSATVRLVDRLAVDGLLERRPGNSGRAIAIHLTTAGEVVARQVLDRRHCVLRASLTPLDGPERAVLTTMLEKILSSITAGPDHGERICRMCDLDACPTPSCPVNLVAERIGVESGEPTVPRSARPVTGRATLR